MPAYSGRFLYSDSGGAPLNQGPCRLTFDAETLVLTPSSGSPVAFDLGDIDAVTPGEWELGLSLYTGCQLNLRQFGPAFSGMAGELLTAWRDRTVQCLLLEDLAEVKRYQGCFARAGMAPAPAEIRIFESNIAVLPATGMPFQWRLADVDALTFDQASYSLVLQAGPQRLALSKLAKKTDECMLTLRAALDALRARSAAMLRELFPFLDPGAIERLLAVMPEGRSARVAPLSQIHPQLPEALLARAVQSSLRPYFDALEGRTVRGELRAGFKFIRPEEGGLAPEPVAEADPEAAVETAPDPAATGLLMWFFFPLADGQAYRNVLAWEAVTGSGRATYLFRLVAPEAAGWLADPAKAPGVVDNSVGWITRALGLLNFRREPIFVSEDALSRQVRLRRYAIGCRKLPELRALRAAFLGRAIHTSPEAWTAQLESLLSLPR